MSDERKAALVALSERYQVPLIENDVWGDTVYRGEAPPAKAFDRGGLVLYCSSFSKSLMPGLRIGWAAAGRFQKRFRELKQLSTITSTSISQIVMGRLLESGFYAQHLRELRGHLHDQVDAMAREVRRCFPPGTRLTRPTGAACCGCACRAGWIPGPCFSAPPPVASMCSPARCSPGRQARRLPAPQRRQPAHRPGAPGAVLAGETAAELGATAGPVAASRPAGR